MENIEKLNTVDGNKQVIKNVFFEGNPNGKPRIMFLGNSITYHEPKHEIGWHGSWGMAASKKENDYVHKVISAVLKKYPNAAFCIVQGSVWEVNYTTCDYNEKFSQAKDFKPDILISSLSANIPQDKFEKEVYKKNLKKLHDYLSARDIKIMQLSAYFGNSEKNDAIKEYCEEYDAYLVWVSDILQKEENRATGLFEHEGVQAHPGDKGMGLISERILETLENFI